MDILRHYRFTTVIYGMTPASYLTTQCLLALAESVEKNYSQVSQVIARDFYIDDLMTGTDTMEECIKLQLKINAIFASAKMNLRKWSSNSRKVLQHMSQAVNDPLFNLEIKDGDTDNH